jgi:hypothetical protein
MPVSYEIDATRSLVRTRCSGTVELADVLGHFATLQRDPARPAWPDVLLDFTGLESLPSSAQLGAVKDRMSWKPAFRFRYCAIVADRDVVFGIARMFQSMTTAFFEDLTVVRSLPDAEAWLAQLYARHGPGQVPPELAPGS